MEGAKVIRQQKKTVDLDDKDEHFHPPEMRKEMERTENERE